MTVGSGTNQPTGIVTASVAAGLTNVFPRREHGARGGSRVPNSNARWMFSDTMLKIVKKRVDGNHRPRDLVPRALTREALATVIADCGLYSSECSAMPTEDVVKIIKLLFPNKTKIEGD